MRRGGPKVKMKQRNETKLHKLSLYDYETKFNFYAENLVLHTSAKEFLSFATDKFRKLHLTGKAWIQSRLAPLDMFRTSGPLFSPDGHGVAPWES